MAIVAASENVMRQRLVVYSSTTKQNTNMLKSAKHGGPQDLELRIKATLAISTHNIPRRWRRSATCNLEGTDKHPHSRKQGYLLNFPPDIGT